MGKEKKGIRRAGGSLVVLLAVFAVQPFASTPSLAEWVNQGIQFLPPPDAALVGDPKRPLQVGVPYAFDLCRGAYATEAEKGKLNPSDATCGDAYHPSTTVSGGNPPYHFQLEPMGGFPPMGMWVDLNGVLRGKPKNTNPASFSVCAVDLGGRSDCKRINMNQIQPAQGGAGGNAGKAAAAVAGGTVGALGLIWAAGQLANLTSTTTGSCVSNRTCIVNVMSSGCSCAGSVNGNCGWTGLTAAWHESCGAGLPCESGLSCNNGRCESSSGRCPF